MYHLELRQFPHNLCRFNLTEQDLRSLLAPWVLEKPLELGERKWSPHEATITVLEGPRLELQQLSMGRGWRAAQRASDDVTARVIAAATAASGVTAPHASAQAPAGPPQAASDPSVDASLTADPLALGVQLASLLGGDAARLLEAWRQASAENPGRSPSETLAFAEAAVRSSSPGPGRGGDR
jgi:hypothetical protein